MVMKTVDIAPHIRGKPIRGWPPLARDETTDWLLK